jgi:uncharacterized protein
MSSESSRRDFLAAGLTLPVAGLAASRTLGAISLPAAALPYRTLGKTGPKVTPVGFGCMITSDPSVIARAIDLGINYFDTARVYQGGNNERMVGAALKDSRNKIILSSKSGANNKAGALAHLETSLKELGTDHLDIWYMHSKDNPDAINDDMVDAWLTAKSQGKVRFIGVSTHNVNAIVDRVLQVGKFEVLLNTYNFTIAANNDASYKRLSDAGVGLVAMKVMAPAGPGRASSQQQLKRAGGPLSALKWVLKNPLFSTTIPSMTDADQLEMNFRAMSEKFGTEDEKLLAVLNEEVRPYYCRFCHECSGVCPKGLPVADTIRFLSYADFYGQFALGREHFLQLPEEVRNVRCSDCSNCPIQCPNGVHVIERLTRAQELFA